MVCDCWWCDIQGALLGDNWLYKCSRRCYPFGTDRWRLQSLRRRMAEAAAAWAAGAVACCGWRESRHGPRLQEGMERAPQRSSGWKSCKVAQPSLYRLRRTCVPACGCRHGEGNPLATGLPVLLLGSHFLLPRIEEIIFGPRCFVSRYLKAQRMSMFSSVSPPSFPPFPLRLSGGACAGAPRPLPGVVAHGRGCVRRQPRPFPSFLSDFLPSLPVLLGVRVLVLHVLCLEWWPMAEGACDASHVPSLPFFLTLPPFPLRPSGGACAGAPRPLPGVVAHGRGCVRRQPRPFPSFLSGSSSLPSPSFWGCVCWCSTSSAWSGGPWQRVRATPATSLPFLPFWLFLPSLPVLLGVRCIPRCFFAQQLNA